MRWRFTFWTVAAVFPLPLLVSLVGLDPTAWAEHWAVLMGVLAYAWWLLAILLSVRPQWLDRKVGLPSVYALHGLLGVCAVIAAYLHQDNSSTGIALAAQLGDWGFYLSLFVVCYSMFMMSGWFTDRSPLIAKIKTSIDRITSHSSAIWIHRLNLVVLAMIWLHTHLFPFLVEVKAFIITFNVMTMGTLAAYAWKKFLAPRGYLKGTVTANAALNPKTRQVVITLNPESKRGAHHEPQPGDYFFLQFDAPGVVKEWHPFSLTDAETDTVTFTIRQIGDFTNTVASIPEGTPVRLEGPFGLFNSIVEATPSDQTMVLLGMGAGVAPLMSLADGHSAKRTTKLLWSVRDQDDAYYADALKAHQAANPNRFSHYIQTGRFTLAQLADLITPDERATGVFFLVGPNPAVLYTERLLRQLGVSSGRIHHERMTF